MNKHYQGQPKDVATDRVNSFGLGVTSSHLKIGPSETRRCGEIDHETSTQNVKITLIYNCSKALNNAQ